MSQSETLSRDLYEIVIKKFELARSQGVKASSDIETAGPGFSISLHVFVYGRSA